MNANELADVLDKTGWNKRFTEWDLLDEVATMLRQQQAEVEALRSLSLRRENLGYFYDLHARQQAEIELLKANMNTATKELLQKQDEIEALKAELKLLDELVGGKK